MNEPQLNQQKQTVLSTKFPLWAATATGGAIGFIFSIPPMVYFNFPALGISWLYDKLYDKHPDGMSLSLIVISILLYAFAGLILGLALRNKEGRAFRLTVIILSFIIFLFLLIIGLVVWEATGHEIHG